jgi:hypothetical protein
MSGEARECAHDRVDVRIIRSRLRIGPGTDGKNITVRCGEHLKVNGGAAAEGSSSAPLADLNRA